MVDVFCTSVNLPADAELLLTQLSSRFPDVDFSFDLEDCDRILRAVHDSTIANDVVRLLENAGFRCEMLD